MSEDDEINQLTWENVAISYGLLLLTVAISSLLRTRVSAKLVFASLRCFLQLNVMGLVLKPILLSQSLLPIAVLSLTMMTIGTIEITQFKLHFRIRGLFLVIFFCMAAGCTSVAMFGTVAVLGSEPYYNPRQYLPILGMLLGNCITGITLSLRTFFEQIHTHRDRIDYVLGVGGTRWEATKFAFIHSLQIGLLPCINSMSMQGFVSIPGMMTGQILAGMDAMQAVKFQQILNFLMCSSTCATTLLSTFFVYKMIFNDRDILEVQNLHNAPVKEVIQKCLRIF